MCFGAAVPVHQISPRPFLQFPGSVARRFCHEITALQRLTGTGASTPSPRLRQEHTTAAAAAVWIPSIAASMPIAANTSRTSLGFPRAWGPPRFLGRPLLACRGRTHDTRCADFVWAKLPHPRHLRVGVGYWHSFSLDGPQNRSEPCRDSVPIVLSHTP